MCFKSLLSLMVKSLLCLLVVALVACGGGGGKGSSATPANNNSTNTDSTSTGSNSNNNGGTSGDDTGGSDIDETDNGATDNSSTGNMDNSGTDNGGTDNSDTDDSDTDDSDTDDSDTDNSGMDNSGTSDTDGEDDGTTTSPSIYRVTGSLTGLEFDSVVFDITAPSGKHSWEIYGDRDLTFLTGLISDDSYEITVSDQPRAHSCVVANGSGVIADADVDNVQITCTRLYITLDISSPESGALVPVDSVEMISVEFVDTQAEHLYWEVLPASLSDAVDIQLVGSTDTSAQFQFTISHPADYRLTLRTADDNLVMTSVELRVHQEYLMGDALTDPLYLQADGTVRSVLAGAPTQPAKAVAQGVGYALAILSDDTVYQWGSQVPVPSDLGPVKSVTAGYYFATAIKADNTLAVWGELNASPAIIPDTLLATRFIAADATISKFAAIGEDGSLVGWSGSTGEVLDIPAGWEASTFTQVCSTEWHAVVLDSDGGVHVWDLYEHDGDPGMNMPPATSGPVTKIVCGLDHAALQQEDGRIMMWGEESGLFFDSTTLPDFPAVKSIVPWGYRFITENGALVNDEGELDTQPDNW